MKKIALALLGLALLFPQENASAQCRDLFGRRQVAFHHVVQRQAVVQQVAYAYPSVQVRYFLGEDIQVEALAEKLAPKLSARLAPQIIAALKADGVNVLPPVNGNGAATTANGNGGVQLSAAVKARPVFVAKCLRCHIGDNPKGGVSFENGMTDAQFRKFVGFFRSPALAPKGMQGVLAGLSAADKGAIAEELHDFIVPEVTANDERLDVPAPPIPMPDGDEDQGAIEGESR